jgi:hypothetical protein
MVQHLISVPGEEAFKIQNYSGTFAEKQIGMRNGPCEP